MSSLDLDTEEMASHEPAMHQAMRLLSVTDKNTFDHALLNVGGLNVEEESSPDLSRIFHEAPNDIMELIVMNLSNVDEIGWGWGGMNMLRLVCKRLMRLVDLCATRLTKQESHGLYLFPKQKCERIEHIGCPSRSLGSLEGCPIGLKSLHISHGDSLQCLEPLRGCTEIESLKIYQAYHISDLNPLIACTSLKKLSLQFSLITDISTLSSVPLLEELALSKLGNRYQSYQPSIEGLSPLIQCKSLRVLDIGGNEEIGDLSPLAQCTQLEKLFMDGLIKITDLKALSSLTKLKYLNIDRVPVKDVTPLSVLQALKQLYCQGIPLTTSLLPLARCSKLKRLCCTNDTKGWALLRERRPDIFFQEDGEEEDT